MLKIAVVDNPLLFDALSPGNLREYPETRVIGLHFAADNICLFHSNFCGGMRKMQGH